MAASLVAASLVPATMAAVVAMEAMVATLVTEALAVQVPAAQNAMLVV